MQTIRPLREEYPPYLQLLFLALYGIIGLLVFAVIGLIIAVLLYGVGLFNNTDWLNGSVPAYVPALKIILTARQIGLFLTPAILLAITEGKKPNHFYGIKLPKASLLLLVFLIMICAMPLLGLINEINQKMHLPKFLEGVETWMRKMEDEGEITTKAILQMNSIPGLLLNLLVIAIVPAICEEFIFRGGIQRTLIRWFKNPHVAIWTAAIIFSTIHFQFFGFFPRLILGALFGYIYFWTGSIWYTIFAHFLNNAYAVIIAFYLQKSNLPLDSNDGTTVAWYGYLISAVFTIALLKLLRSKCGQEALRQ